MEDGIQISNLQFSYGQQAVLRGLNLTVATGEIIGLIGKNGAGKTTLLDLLLGLRQPAHGRIRIWGQRPDRPAVRQRIGAMRQGDLIIGGVTVLDLLRLAAAQYPNAQEPLQLLDQLGLSALGNRLLVTLSGGQRRRVTLAVALIGRPQLLLLDEPTVGMDATAQQAFWQRVQVLKQQGTTVIITSHYLTEIEHVADRICLLQGGRFIFQGSFAALQHQYRRVVITAQTTLALPLFTGLPGVTTATKSGTTIRLNSLDGDATLQALIPYQPALHQLTVSRESLADIFIQLTKQGESL